MLDTTKKIWRSTDNQFNKLDPFYNKMHVIDWHYFTSIIVNFLNTHDYGHNIQILVYWLYSEE